MSAKIISDDTPRPAEKETVFWWEFVPKSIQDQLQKYPDNPFLLACVAKLCPEVAKASNPVAWLQDTPVPEEFLKMQVSRPRVLEVVNTPAGARETDAHGRAPPAEGFFRMEYFVTQTVHGQEYFSRSDTRCMDQDFSLERLRGLSDDEIARRVRDHLEEYYADGYEWDYEAGDPDYDDSEVTDTEDQTPEPNSVSLTLLIRQVREYEREHPQAVPATR